MAAQSIEEVAALLKSADQNPEDAENIWKEICAQREGKHLSPDELEAVSGGGEDRDWLKQGCAATVERGSWCGSNDACTIWSVVYKNNPVKDCPQCNGRMYVTRYGITGLNNYKCVDCGYEISM